MGLGTQIERFVKSKVFKSIMPKLYGWGASVVVMGALFKLEHWAGADYMLSAGLITEAVIFFFYAFESEEEHPVITYPNMVGISDEEVDGNDTQSLPSHQVKRLGAVSNSLALAKFDEMLVNAEISPDLLLNFGDGIRRLGETAENMNALGDVYTASRKYIKTIQVADDSLGKLAKAYENSIVKVTSNTVFKYQSIARSLSIIEDESRTYQQQLESLNKNLATLNNVYKMQARGSDEYIRDLEESAAETKKYREQITELNKNLSVLNKFYKNMRSSISKE
jgi:gliding motility-associated protein GldL